MEDKTFFGIFGLLVQNIVRWVILIGRRYQIVPAFYLVVFFIGIIGYANTPVTPPPLPPPAPTSNRPNTANNTSDTVPAPVITPTLATSTTPNTSNNSTPTSTPTLDPASSNPTNSSSNSETSSTPPAVKVAQAKAYRNGNLLTIRFNKPVSQVALSVDEVPVTINCEPDTNICTATLPKEAVKGALEDSLQAEVYWSQETEKFSIRFRL